MGQKEAGEEEELDLMGRRLGFCSPAASRYCFTCEIGNPQGEAQSQGG